MIIEYNEKTFFNSFINEYNEVSNDHNKSEIIFQNNYNKLLEKFTVNDIIHHYSNNDNKINDNNDNNDDNKNNDNKINDNNDNDNNDDNDDNDNKIKLGLILHLKLLVYIMNDYYNDDEYIFVQINKNET
jgi:hypothetical protein